MELTVIRDSREKLGEGWNFAADDKKGYITKVIGTEIKGLDAGDYSLKEYPELLRIERKAGILELFGNIANKAHLDRFYREMEKLRSIKYKYIFIEDNLSNDILGMSLPQMRYGFPGSNILKTLFDIQIDYGVNFLFVGNAGKKTSRYLFETIMKKELKGK